MGEDQLRDSQNMAGTFINMDMLRVDVVRNIKMKLTNTEFTPPQLWQEPFKPATAFGPIQQILKKKQDRKKTYGSIHTHGAP